MPTPAQNHVSQPLTNFSLQMLQSEMDYCALRMFPRVTVNKERDVYYRYTTEDFLRNLAKKRGENTEVALGDYGLTTDSFFCQEWGFGKDISEREARNADSILRPEQNAVTFVTRVLLTCREINFATNFFGGGIWGTDLQGVSGAPGGGQFRHWSDPTNGDPIGDIDSMRTTMLLATGYQPNKLMVTFDVWNELKNHPSIIARLAYNNPGFAATGGKVTIPMVAEMMDLAELHVCKAIYNTSNIPGAPVNAFVCGTKKALLCYVEPNPQPESASAGYHFVWSGDNGANEEGFAIYVEDVPLRNTRERVSAGMFIDPKVVAPALGIYLYDVIA